MSKKSLYYKPHIPTNERVNNLLAHMTTDQKIGQMIQAEFPHITLREMEEYGIGSLLSGGQTGPAKNTVEAWKKRVIDYQQAARKSTLKIPAIFGIDAVHGHNNVYGATMFPHNIGLGAANDEEGMFEMGYNVAKEVFATGFNWNFAPCVALANDPRWGRTYESFSTDMPTVNRLALAYSAGQLNAGMVICAKHYLGDGGTKMGTGLENKSDRGDTVLTKKAIQNTLLVPYQEQVNLGVQTIMPSYSSLNGIKMHQNAKYINKVLKRTLNFEGFVISDWEAIREIPNANFEEQVWISINAGVDMLMEPIKWKGAFYAIRRGIENGQISMKRIDDAVSRILTVKFDSGLFEDPTMTKQRPKARSLRTIEARKIAQKLAEKSLVLLKNETNLLPLKSKTKVFVTGAGANNIGLQCGGWTIDWNGLIDEHGIKSTEGITILEGLKNLNSKNELILITDNEKAHEADVVLQVLSEVPYAEMQGDSEDIEITGQLGHPENKTTMSFVNTLNKPIITILFAGRHLANLEKDLAKWDSCIMAYLPGSEGGTAIANVLVGKRKFQGKLPMPWYKTVGDIEKKKPKLLFELGYGLK